MKLYLALILTTSRLLSAASSGPEHESPLYNIKSIKNDAMACYQVIDAAANGDASAQNTMGEMYWTGTGLPLDLDKAKDYFERAAEQDFPEAEKNLGDMYKAMGDKYVDYAKTHAAHASKVYGVEKSRAQAEANKCLEQSKKEYNSAIFYYSRASDHGHIEASFILGCIFLDGTWGVTKYESRGYQYIEIAAIKGYADAQNKLGEYYYNHRDPAQAKIWYLRAAEQNHAQATYNLGMIFKNQSDIWNAKEYFQKAAVLGCSAAQEIIRHYPYCSTWDDSPN